MNMNTSALMVEKARPVLHFGMGGGCKRTILEIRGQEHFVSLRFKLAAYEISL